MEHRPPPLCTSVAPLSLFPDTLPRQLHSPLQKHQHSTFKNIFTNKL
jgi:hypothetical protein